MDDYSTDSEEPCCQEPNFENVGRVRAIVSGAGEPIIRETGLPAIASAKVRLRGRSDRIRVFFFDFSEEIFTGFMDAVVTTGRDDVIPTGETGGEIVSAGLAVRGTAFPAGVEI